MHLLAPCRHILILIFALVCHSLCFSREQKLFHHVDWTKFKTDDDDDDDDDEDDTNDYDSLV